ncbi:MAG: glycosyltransferase family 4 protein [Acidobacteriota bacterium]
MAGLRFCMVTTYYPPYNFGGDGIGIQRFSRALVRRGHQVTVLQDIDGYNSLSPTPDPPLPAEDDGVEVVRIRSRVGALSVLMTHQFGRPLFNRGALKRFFAEREFDVINYHNVSLVGGPGVYDLGDAVKVQMAHEHWLVCPTHVLWRHGRELCDGRQCVRCQLSYKRPPQLWRSTGLLERKLTNVDACIAMSEFSQAKHREFGFPRDMEVVNYFLPNREDAASSPTTNPHERPYCLFVGRLEKIKGLDDIIPAFRDYPHADLLILGDGEYRPELERLARGQSNVRFLGRLAPEELDRYYEHALALVVPSVCFETFGIIVIEAFRQGTPVLARNIGPLPETLARSGAGATFDDGEQFLAELEKIRLDPELRAELGHRGTEAFDRLWSEDAVLPQYLEVVRKAAVARGREDVAERLTSA